MRMDDTLTLTSQLVAQGHCYPPPLRQIVTPDDKVKLSPCNRSDSLKLAVVTDIAISPLTNTLVIGLNGLLLSQSV